MHEAREGWYGASLLDLSTCLVLFLQYLMGQKQYLNGFLGKFVSASSLTLSRLHVQPNAPGHIDPTSNASNFAAASQTRHPHHLPFGCHGQTGT